ncbi:16S rRNA (guanine(1207)-N(2))-methyltransferase RsmC [Candidatus Gillettellia adelgis]
MTIFTDASEVVRLYSNEFIKRRVLFSGDLQDILPTQFAAIEVRAHTQQYHHWQLLTIAMGDNVQFGLTVDTAFVAECNTLIYYWPKSKEEAQFQLRNILSKLSVGSDVFVVGKNRSGVRSIEKAVEGLVTLIKIHSARHCSFYRGRLDVQATFNLANWWHSYSVYDLVVKTLPGVFSSSRLDIGSALLLSTLENTIRGKVLDIGCGAGVIAAVLAKLSPHVQLTLSDVSAAALHSSHATLSFNHIQGEVIVSNVYSDVIGRFNMIISNPPFHNGLLNSLVVAQTLIHGALEYLMIGGYLRIVANTFLPYPDILDATFGSHEVLAKNNCFTVYQTIKRRSTCTSKKIRL